MLNFSNINVLIIYFLFIFIAIFSSLNFQDENNKLIKKKINLGLDSQGGSYLLLEINSDSLVEEKIQYKVIPLKRGDEIITSGGIIGTIERVMEDDRIEVNIGENVNVNIIKSTITSLLKKEEVKK